MSPPEKRSPAPLAGGKSRASRNIKHGLNITATPGKEVSTDRAVDLTAYRARVLCRRIAIGAELAAYLAAMADGPFSDGGGAL